MRLIGTVLGVVFDVLGARLGALLGQQRFAVGHRNLLVVRVNFAERQEAVAVAAVIDEGRLERGLHAGHLG